MTKKECEESIQFFRSKIKGDAPKGPYTNEYYIVRNNGELHIDNPMCKMFGIYNIVKYCDPDETFDMDVIWRALIYAYEKILFEEEHITLSFATYDKDEQVFEEIKNYSEIKKQEAGIYNLNGLAAFPVQLVVLGELEGEENAVFRIMTYDPDLNDVAAVMKQVSKEPKVANTLIPMMEKYNPGIIERAKREKGQAVPAVD